MRIGVDCRLWKQTGIGRYTQNLVVNLAHIDSEDKYILFALPQDVTSIRNSINAQNFSIVITDIPWHGLSEQINFPRLLNDKNLDLMHFPYFSVPLFYKKPFIVTVHDLIINAYKTGRASTLPYPIYLAKRVGYSIVLSNALRSAQKIIVPSNSVKDDLLATYKNLDTEKVVPIYEGGFEENGAKKVKNESKVPGRYILRVGNFYPHKNVGLLIEAFREFLYDNYENHDLKLVLVGKRDFFYKKIEGIITNSMLSENVIFLENTKDIDLINLYQNATATIIPSFMEGFSLTGIEALSCGSPLIASDIAVHREIFENAAIYCNPRDTHDIKHKISFIINLDDKSKNELISQGLKQAKKYSWQKMARETLAIYKSIDV